MHSGRGEEKPMPTMDDREEGEEASEKRQHACPQTVRSGGESQPKEDHQKTDGEDRQTDDHFVHHDHFRPASIPILLQMSVD